MTDRPRIAAAAFSVSQLARRWSVSERSIRREIDAGRLRHFKVQSLIRVLVEEVERFEAGGTDESGSKALEPSPVILPLPTFSGRRKTKPLA